MAKSFTLLMGSVVKKAIASASLTITSTKKKHAKFSASGAQRWLTCVASTRLIEYLGGEDQDSIYAQEGNDAHAVLEWLGRTPDASNSEIRALYKQHPKEMVDYALDTIHRYEKLAAKLHKPKILIDREVKLPVKLKGQFGTADVIIVEEFGTLYVIDYKYGAGVKVYAKENEQMIYYALGVAEEYGFNFTKVVLIIAQPRNTGKSGEVFDTWSTNVATLKKWQKIFNVGIDKALAVPGTLKFLMSKKAPYSAGKKQCRFCPAQPICPAWPKMETEEALSAFDDWDGFDDLKDCG